MKLITVMTILIFCSGYSQNEKTIDTVYLKNGTTLVGKYKKTSKNKIKICDKSKGKKCQKIELKDIDKITDAISPSYSRRVVVVEDGEKVKSKLKYNRYKIIKNKDSDNYITAVLRFKGDNLDVYSTTFSPNINSNKLITNYLITKSNESAYYKWFRYRPNNDKQNLENLQTIFNSCLEVDNLLKGKEYKKTKFNLFELIDKCTD